jgi:TPR repeat protein
LLYQKGQGVTQDYAKAREWYQKAADAGDPIAMDNLGVLYRDGPGGAQDSKRPPTPATRPAGRIRTAGVSPKITPRRASGTKRPPMPATQMRSKRSPASTQSSNALGIPAWITGP